MPSLSRVGTPLWRLSCTSCGDGCTSLLHVLPWHSPGSSHPPLLSSQCHPSQTPEQFLFIVMHEFPYFILHVTHSFVLVIFVNNPAYPLCIFCYPLLFPRLLAGPFSVVPPLLWHLDVPVFLFVPFLDRVAHCVNTSVSMRASAFTSHPHSNLSRVGDRSYACVDKSSSLPHRTQPTRTSTDPPLLFSSPAWT